TGEEFADRSSIIYVNSRIQDETELGRLMHDLNCRNADDVYSTVLAERIRELKETEEGVRMMCEAMDKIYREGLETGEKRGLKIGEKRGIEKTKKEMARAFADMGMPAEQIALGLKENSAVVQQWISEEKC
ncbi:MAG: hypothetical protein ACOX8E_03065, partial [Ruminococcus sp.]